MSKIGWIDNDLKTVWVVCDECQKLKQKHWAKAGTISQFQKGKKGRVTCRNRHEIEIDSLRFLRKGLRPRE